MQQSSIHRDSASGRESGHRNLVVVRAGDGSLHRGWGAGEAGCGFDLIVSYFGDDPSAYCAPYENRCDQKGGKWDGIHALFAQRPDLLQFYDYFWFPDDDIEADRATIEGIFAAMVRFDLAVTQPALTLDSYYSHFPLLRSRSFELRYVDMVEIMVPCLNAETLARMLPLFAGSMGGYGLDLIWTRLAANNYARSAILDALPVRHTRPVGNNMLVATMSSHGRTQRSELLELQQFHGLGLGAFHPFCYEAIDIEGRRWRSPAAIGVRMAMDHLSARGSFLQTHQFARNLWRLVRRQSLQTARLSPLTIANRG